jgi:nucleotide-binding universal stress UspA family protein
MLPVKRIVCPTDFSELSLQALREAVDLATHFGADIHLLNVIPSSDFPTDSEGIILPNAEEEYCTAVREKLSEIATRFASKGLHITAVVELGDPADQIVRFARDKQADLIVIATHGAKGWRHIAFGSVAEKVVRFAACPVLTIRTVAGQAATAA